jgi:hypothetical protein
MKLFSLPIVGAHFRPPAKQLLTVLPLGTPLVLRAEPDNPYDDNAVQVLVSLTDTYPVSQWPILATALQGTGYDPQDLVDREAKEGPLHIGYVPRSGAKTALGGPGNAELLAALAPDWAYTASLGVAPQGHPIVNVQVPEPTPA